LILWHGRLSYKRSSVLAQFVIHRGLIISIIQAVFSIIFFFVAIPVYNGYLMMGYTTVYTSLPVFALVYDHDVDLKTVLKYPTLYKSLQKGRSLNFKTFMIWVWISIYQGSVIMLFSIIFFNDSFVNIVSITFTALIFIELLNVFTQVNHMKPKILLATLLTILIYLGSILFFR
jgi:phospholipid-translocating ATPase